ncbi:hypothetical protein EYF80_057525 [Liparis tanakae]|uniref:Uncharacterized protein n=1 Tax=Liparis tanakae TaxID=230148 RepID=A0A4Z2ETT8_9TELE|nr:hypothetical protein EYF80_057525 [Liparis tanakae]
MDLATIRDPKDLQNLKTLKATFHSRHYLAAHLLEFRGV